jgi:hypothetical protein
MAWRAARSLLTLHKQLKVGSRAAPPATGADEWGLIGDAEHDPTSDHSPHNFPGWGDQIVTAADFPNRPDLGLDARRVLDDIRRSRDGRVKYGISNGQMFSSYATSSYPAWTWRPYSGKDGHFTHGHLSVVGDGRADGEQFWQTIGQPASNTSTNTPEVEDDDMGASFGPVAIEHEGVTSLSLPPAGQGLADPRDIWVNICNDLVGREQDRYCLRIWYTTGNKAYASLPGTTSGFITLESGEIFSQQLPRGTRNLSIYRWGLVAGDGDVPKDPRESGAIVYPGHLTVAFERGAVIKA